MWHLDINSNMNFPAPIAALGFLTACAGILLSACALAVAAFVRKRQIAQLTLLIIASGAFVYFSLLFGFSLASRDHLLAHGQEKYFCEIDCHLAYSVLTSETRTCGGFGPLRRNSAHSFRRNHHLRSPSEGCAPYSLTAHRATD